MADLKAFSQEVDQLLAAWPEEIPEAARDQDVQVGKDVRWPSVHEQIKRAINDRVNEKARLASTVTVESDADSDEELGLPKFPAIKEWNDNRWKSDFQTATFSLKEIHDGADVTKGTRFRRNSIILDRHKTAVDEFGPLPTKKDAASAFGEMIVTVQFFGLRKTPENKMLRPRTAALKEAEFEILGSQTLADLKDVMFCESDHSIDSEFSRAAGCFYIDGLFYVDNRESSANYAECYFDWIEHKFPARLKSREVKQMSEVKLIDLATLPIVGLQDPDMSGQGICLYVHQGNCEHQFVFSGIRKLLPPFDTTQRLAYPMIKYRPRPRITFCECCTKQPAVHRTFNNPWTSDQRFCDRCFNQYHYDSEGQLWPELATIKCFKVIPLVLPPMSLKEVRHRQTQNGGLKRKPPALMDAEEEVRKQSGKDVCVKPAQNKHNKRRQPAPKSSPVSSSAAPTPKDGAEPSLQDFFD